MEQWSSKTGFILAAIGSAVGIGNIWRFSAVVGQNGGGAYLIPYLSACIFCALPLMALEMAAGRAVRGDVVSVFSSAVRGGNRFGWLICTIVFFILCYYLVITGWTLAFVFFSAAGITENFSAFTSSYEPLAFFIISTVLTSAIVSLGVRAGIERVSSVLIPFIFVILAVMALFASTLPGFYTGIRYFLSPDFSVLINPVVWSAALGQSFFSLSVGQGILITYGAYIGKEVDLFRSAIIIMVFDISASVLAGLVIFPIVFSYGLSPSMGAELAFVTLPQAFLVMPYGQLIAIAFFSLLFIAALTSAMSILEVDVAALMTATRFSRRQVCAALCLFILLVGMPAALSYSTADLSVAGIRILDIMDEIFGTIGLILTALITSIILAWYSGKEKVQQELYGIGIIHSVILNACRFVIPSLLSAALVFRIAANADVPDWRIVPDTTGIGCIPLLAVSGFVITGIVIIIFVICRISGGECPWKHWMR